LQLTEDIDLVEACEGEGSGVQQGLGGDEVVLGGNRVLY